MIIHSLLKAYQENLDSCLYSEKRATWCTPHTLESPFPHQAPKKGSAAFIVWKAKMNFLFVLRCRWLWTAAVSRGKTKIKCSMDPPVQTDCRDRTAALLWGEQECFAAARLKWRKAKKEIWLQWSVTQLLAVSETNWYCLTFFHNFRQIISVRYE